MTAGSDDFRGNLAKKLGELARAQRLENAQRQVSGITATEEDQALKEGSLERDSRHEAETEAIKQKNEDRIANRALRDKYARYVFVYLVSYSLFVGGLLLLSGFDLCTFSLPDSVLGLLVGSTAASAIGLVFAVTHGLFSGLEK
jgi:hypothetical protein